MDREVEFMWELRAVLNKYSKENGSNTPDFILAKYLSDCLISFNKTSRAREKWYEKSLRIGGGKNANKLSTTKLVDISS